MFKKLKISKLFISLFILLVGCSEPEPINIKLLKQVDGIYYNSENKPYSGEVFRTYSDNSGDILSSGTLEDGYPLTYIEPVNTEQLNYRNDGVFLINTSTPFTGSYFINIDGNIIEEGAYLNGKLHGKLVGYYPSGQVEYEGYATDGQVSSTNSFHENGQLQSQIEYLDNKPLLERYYYENGQLKEQKSFSNEKLNGPYLSYYEDGQLRKEITYDNDTMNSHTYYFRNGKVEQEGSSDCDYTIYGYDINEDLKTDLTYKDCKKFNGFMTTTYGSNVYENKYKRFYKNGVEVKEEYELFDTDLQYVKTKGAKLMGEREGLWESYFSDGNIEEQKNYKEGKLHGSSKAYHYNGILKLHENYRFGKLNGMSIEYEMDGVPSSKIEYVDGYKNGIYKTYYFDGKIKQEANFLSDELNGLFREYDSNGSITSEYQYINGLKNGPSKALTRFGEVEVGNYVNDLKEGLFKIYRKDGTLLQERNYKNDRMNGEIISYDENGKVITRITYKNGKPVRESLKLK